MGRRHWGIENRNHYVRDVSYGENKSRIGDNPGIVAQARSFALNILRKNRVTNVAQDIWKGRSQPRSLPGLQGDLIALSSPGSWSLRQTRGGSLWVHAVQLGGLDQGVDHGGAVELGRKRKGRFRHTEWGRCRYQYKF